MWQLLVDSENGKVALKDLVIELLSGGLKKTVRHYNEFTMLFAAEYYCGQIRQIKEQSRNFLSVGRATRPRVRLAIGRRRSLPRLPALCPAFRQNSRKDRGRSVWEQLGIIHRRRQRPRLKF